MYTEFQLGKRKKFWRWIVVMVTEQCTCTYHYRTVHLKVIKMLSFYVMYILPQ